MPQSLSSWCKHNQLPKGTVHARCKDLDIDTSNGLSDTAIAILRKEFKLDTDAQPVASIGDVSIEIGNHRVAGQLAVMPDSINLSDLRKGSELTVFGSDAMAVVDQALTMADELIDAIDEDTDYQLQQLYNTRRANNQLKRKADKLRQRQQQYQIESRVIGLVQGKEAQELQQTMEGLQNLGVGGPD